MYDALTYGIFGNWVTVGCPSLAKATTSAALLGEGKPAPVAVRQTPQKSDWNASFNMNGPRN